MSAHPFKRLIPAGCQKFIPILGLVVILSGQTFGFPPSPYYTLYGIVRDQVGQTVSAEGAEVILYKGSEEIARTPIHSSGRLDQNYELNIRLDQNRSGLPAYSEKALAVQGSFNLAVEINGALFYPIETSGNLTAGNGGERVQMDLNLGEDSDGDGLPDVWEQWQLYQAGYHPDEDGNWPIALIDKLGDFDKDGQSNWLEYVAGTFAGDATEYFDLKIKEKADERVRFAFYAISGKTYTIERTTDMKVWERVAFAIGDAGSGAEVWRAEDVAIVSAYVDPEGEDRTLYRLTVR